MKTALVTGGARGIGRAIGIDLAGRGYRVAFCYRSSEEAAAETASAISAAGGQALAVRADVSEPAQCDALFARVREAFGSPDALIHCAGPYHRVDLLKETPEGWRSMMAHNLDSLFYCARLAAPAMIEKRHGRILAFGMANADRGLAQPQITAHYIAKSGLLVLIRTLAKSLAPHGITANAISPGFISSGSAPDEELQKMVKNIPAGYIGALDDAVSAARYLLSDEARYVNGANLLLSGGWGI
jgi:3-oxoacyl-[acyl-carrier protein] reductase